MLEFTRKLISKPLLFLFLPYSLLLSEAAYSAIYSSFGASASELGNASAGRAANDQDLSNIRVNPAIALAFQKTRFSISTIYSLNTVDIDDDSQNQQLNAEDIGDDAIRPSFFIALPVNQHWAFGLAAFSDFNASTNYPSEYSAGLIAGERTLLTYEFNPHIAVQLTDKLALGFGASVIYGDKEIKTYYGNENMPNPSQQYLDYAASGSDYRSNIGLLYNVDEHNRFGLAYKSGTDIEVTGTLNKYSRNDLLTFNADATHQIMIPSELEFSGFHQLDRRFSLLYSVNWTSWGDLSSNEINNSQCAPDPTLGLNQGQCLSENISAKDNFRVSIASNYKINDALLFRAGLSLESASDSATFSIPNEQMNWLSLGLNMKVNRQLSIDIGTAYGFSQKADIKEDINGTNYRADVKINTMMIGTQINYKFTH